MDSVLIHFPNGSWVFRYPAQELAEGDRVWHEGQAYRVLTIASDRGQTSAVVVEPDSDGLGNLLRSERGGIVLEKIVAPS